MDFSKSMRSFHDNPSSSSSPFRAAALGCSAGDLQDVLIRELVDELDGPTSKSALASHLDLPEDGDLLCNLRAWCSDPDSTVFVLYSVLIRIGREDLANGLLQKMQSMLLCVVIQEEEPGCADPVKSTTIVSNTIHQGGVRYETVMTSCDIDLATALKGILGVDLSYYQIVGPGEWVSWSTKARQLKGKQLTLMHRNSPKCKTDQSIYGCNNMRLPSNTKGYTDKIKMEPQGVGRPPQTLNLDKRRMTVTDADGSGIHKKRPTTLPFTAFNIGSNEDGSPMIEVMKSPPLLLTPSPMPISSDTNNMATYNTTPTLNTSNLCVTPDTEDSLDCHRSSYPCIISPCVEAVEEMEEYEIDDNTYKKVPMSSSTQSSKNNTRSHHNGSSYSSSPTTPQSASISRPFSNHHLLHPPLPDSRLTHIPSHTDSSSMDNIENLNEILGDFSSSGLTPTLDFDFQGTYNSNNNNNNNMNNNNNALNNLNSSSQTDLKKVPQSVDYNQSIDENEPLPHKNNTSENAQHPNRFMNESDGGNDKLENGDQTMEVDSALSSNFTSTNHPNWLTLGPSTSGNGSSGQSASTITDHSAEHHNIPPFGGLSPSEYVPHHLLVTQQSNPAEFADCSSQSVSFQESTPRNKNTNKNNTNVCLSPVDNNDVTITTPERQRQGKRNLADSRRPVIINGNNLSQGQNDAPPNNGLPRNENVPSAVMEAKSTQLPPPPPPPQKAQPMFQPPPPPNYPPPEIQHHAHQQQQQQLLQQQLLQQQKEQLLLLQQQYSQQLQQYYNQQQQHQQQQQPQQPQPQQQHCENPSRTIQPHSLNLHHPSPNAQASFLVHTPFSSEECIANYSEPPSYLDVLECTEQMETDIPNNPVINNPNNHTYNPIPDQMPPRNQETNHLNYAQISNRNIHGATPQHHIQRTANYPTHSEPPVDMTQVANTNGYPVETLSMYGSNVISSPDNMRRMLPAVSVSNASLSTRRQEFEAPLLHGGSSSSSSSRTNHLQEMKFNTFRKIDDTYLTACDPPPYTNTQELMVKPRGSSKSLPPPPPPRQHENYNNNHHHQQHHHHNNNNTTTTNPQQSQYHNSGASDGDSTCYNYIDSSKVSSAMAVVGNNNGAVAGGGGSGGGGGGAAGGASKSLPNDANTRRTIQGSPVRNHHPHLPPPPTPNTSSRMRLEEQLTKVQGWCPDETDLTIERTMEDYRCRDGFYMVWKSQEKNRFMITVSHHRVLNHFLVEEERVGNTDVLKYFVYRHGGYSSESFLDLVNHYIQSGIRQPLVDARISNKAYDVIHIPLRCPLQVKIFRQRKS